MKTNDRANFSENLTFLRRFFAFTQKEAAVRFDISQQAYSQWERGHCLPDEVRLAEVAAFFGHGLCADACCAPRPKN
jgi:Predicted transcriptional regulators